MKMANFSIIAQRVDGRRGAHVRHVVGNGRKLAGAGFIALRLEQLVRDAHLHAVRFAREYQQGFVLRFPAESRHRAVVAVVVRLAGNRSARYLEIRMPADAQRVVRRRVAGLTGQDRRIRNRLNQPSAERRCRNAEDDVVRGELRVVVRLREAAARGADAAADGEQGVHTSIRRPVAVSTNRVSRTGPFAARNGGSVSRPPFFPANATCGLIAGLAPPIAG